VSAFDILSDDILLEHVIPRLGVADWVVLSRVDCRTHALLGPDVTKGGKLRLNDLVITVARLQWAFANGCHFQSRRLNESWLICSAAAAGRANSRY
jgi:hypothetical protein